MMPEKDGAGSSIYSRISTEELENQLRFAFFSEDDLDIEHIDRLMAELERRGANQSEITPEEALRIFYEEYSGRDSIYLDCAYEPNIKLN